MSDVDLRTVFGSLADEARWVGWRYVGSERRKVPIDPKTGGAARSNDPTTWSTLEEANRAVEEYGLEGVGFVLGDGYGGIDLDACRDPETGELTEWAQVFVDGFDSYTEVSPSGGGVKIIASGAPGELPCSEVAMDGPPIQGKHPAVECFVRGRYFTVTGRLLGECPDEIRDAGELGDAWDRMVRFLRERGGDRSNGAAPPVEEAIPSGARNNTLASLAGTMRRRGMEEPEIRAALMETNRRRCEPPLPKDEVRKIAGSVSRYPPATNGPKPTTTGVQKDNRDKLPDPVVAIEAEAPDPPEFCIDGFALEAELGIFAGEGGDWKTTSALMLGGCMAGGYPIFDSRVFLARQSKVLIVSNEDGLGVLLNRLEALIKGHGWDRERVLSNVYFLAREGVSLDSTEWQLHLEDKIEELGIDVVVFDPYAELTTRPENDNDEAKENVRFFRQLNGRGVTVLVVHHAGKKRETGGKLDRIRGASALTSAARFIYFFEQVEMGFSVECLKLSRGEPPEKFVVETDIESAADNRAAWTSARLSYLSEHVAEDRLAEEFVLSNLDVEPGPNSTELKNMAGGEGLNPREVSEALKSLREAGTIDFEKGRYGAKLWYRTRVASSTNATPEKGLRGLHTQPPETSAGGKGTPSGGSHTPDPGQGSDTQPSDSHPLDLVAEEAD